MNNVNLHAAKRECTNRCEVPPLTQAFDARVKLLEAAERRGYLGLSRGAEPDGGRTGIGGGHFSGVVMAVQIFLYAMRHSLVPPAMA
jgi:hypothetical protein